MENDELFYEITPEEARSRKGGLLLLLRLILPPGLLFGFLFAVATGQYERSLAALYYSVIIFLSGVIGRAMTINRYYPYAKRIYRMDKEGITISKGKKTRRYAWEEFNGYFVSGDRMPAQDADAASGSKAGAPVFSEHLGFQTIFYLNLKTYGWKNIRRKYVVVYGEADNSEKVNAFLSSHMPRRQMEARDEAGLMFYEFK